jgi:hypothetical protein
VHDKRHRIGNVQNAIDAQPHDTLFALWLEMNIACALLKSIPKQIIDGILNIFIG